ncbi:MAG: DUF3006 domain-containing protein [bacterium]|nr:DUF3006 domain-containing protein [bacterium]
MSESKTEGIVDQVEGKYARVEMKWREMVEIPLEHLPEGIREGTVLDIIFRINPDREKERRRTVRSLQEELLKRSQG